MGKPPAGHDENARVIVGPADRCSERPTQSDAAIHAAVAYRRQEGLGSCIRCNNAATTRHKVNYGRNALDHKRSHLAFVTATWCVTQVNRARLSPWNIFDQ